MNFVPELRTIHINMSQLCNLNCNFCFIGKPRSKIVLNPEMAVKIFKEFKERTGDNVIIAVNFTGGEPTLHTDRILEIISGIKDVDNKVVFSIYTNLTYKITPRILTLFEKKIGIFTSWDPIHLRFKTKKKFELWRANCKSVTVESVNIVLTRDILALEPEDLFELISSWGINYVAFESLQLTGNAITKNLKIPSKLDDWLCKIYDTNMSDIQISIFEHLKKALICSDNFQEDCISILPNGEVFVEDEIDLGCKICNLHRYCYGKFFQTYEKRISYCQFPKKLFKKIAQDNNINNLQI